MDQNIYTLIGKALRGTATSEELADLSYWRKGDSYIEARYQDLSKIWEAYQKLPEASEVNVEAGWEKQLQLLEARKSKHSSNYWMAIAASVALLMGVFYWLIQKGPMYESNAQILTEIVLPDGSKVDLNKHSELDFEWHDGTRRVSLKGEAFFDVAHNKTAPFIISTAQLKTRVVGTSFNLKYRDSLTIVSVYSGIVEISDGQRKRILKSGMSVSYNHLSRAMLDQADTLNILSWKTGVLTFKNTPIREVLLQLSEQYDTELQLDQESIESRITAHFDNQELSKIISTIELITGEKIIEKNDK